jgi:chemotaxis protein methyltransferase CheR
VATDVRDVEEIEVALLLEAIYRRYGFDFREYAPASLRRRLWRRAHAEGLQTLSALQDRVLRDPVCMERLLLDLSINVTAMFRDPSFYVALREQVAPLLKTYPFSRIWVAGCSTGEEVYSLAIVLDEEELLERTRIYATDINEEVQAGGTRAFSEYYLASYDGARIDRRLLENVVFAQHNLVSDRSFNEFQLIVCRNVMIYFDRTLQDRVLTLFDDSLAKLGVLGLGRKETLRYSVLADRYEELDAYEKLFRKLR